MRWIVGGCLVVLVGTAAIAAAAPARAADSKSAGTRPFEFAPTAEDVARASARHACWQRCGPRRGWAFEFAIPVWVPGVSGEFASGGIEIEPDQGADEILDSFKDLFEVFTELQFGFLGSIHARKGRWCLALDGFGARLGAGMDFRLVDGTLIDARIWTVVIRGAAKYEFLERPVRVPLFGTCCLRASAVAGARYYGAGFKAKLPLGIELKDSEQWVDPVVGLDLTLDVSQRVRLRLEGDVGGFGVGSDFAWWLVAALNWQFAKRWTLLCGYSFLQVNYGESADFAWKIHLQGPVLGIQYAP